MVRIQRFALAFMLIGSLALSGCANTRTRFASLWKRGADDTFSESIVDNRELPKSAREMADSVQSSLKDTKTKATESKDVVAATTKKRYTKASGKLDSLDTRIDDVIARAKTRSQDVKSKSDFPDDPFLEEFDALADKPARVADKAKNSVSDRLDAAKKKMAAARDAFGGETDDVAEPLISKADSFGKQLSDKVESKVSDFEDTVDDANPFEELDDIVADHAVELDELDEPVAAFIEKTKDVADTTHQIVADVKKAASEPEFEDLPDTIVPEKVAKTGLNPFADEVVATVAPVEKSTGPAEQSTEANEILEDEFDLLFAEAGPSNKGPKRAFQESQFRPASAQRSAKKVERKVEQKRQETPPIASRVDPRFGTDFDRMIVDSNEIPQRAIPTQKQVAESNTNSSDDQFTGVENQLSTYDDFFEADNSVRANQPREASRESNPFSVIETDRESKPTTLPVVVPEKPSVPFEQPTPVSPFEEFEEFEGQDEFDDNMPVAQSTPKPTSNKQPMRLVSMPSVVRVSGNSAANLTDRNRDPVQQQPATEFSAFDSESDRTPPAELPSIVPGQSTAGFSDEPYIDLSAVTQTPLENVAWEVESQSDVTSAAKGTSPWMAWIAVALCSIALILLLRPAANRIS